MTPPLDRITIDPRVCFGKPCIKGTRIWVSLILDFLASGETEAQILAQYPQLQSEDIRAALAYADLAREHIVRHSWDARSRSKQIVEIAVGFDHGNDLDRAVAASYS